MRAVVCPRYGPPEVLRLAELEKPTPREDEVLVRVRATAVTASDLFIRGSDVEWKIWLPFRLMMGLTRPRRAVIGEVLAGEVEAVGARTTRFGVGDRVYGLTGFRLGAYAEYATLREADSKQGCLAPMPENLGFEEATAAAYGGLLALQAIEKARVTRGERVLVYGASGTTGTIAVQVLKDLGAHVTAVCGPAHQALVRSLGADAVLDYTREASLAPGVRFEVVLDAVGKAKTSRLRDACARALSPGGRSVSIDDGALECDSGRLERLGELILAGHVKPVLDRCYPLEQIVEAHRYVAAGHKQGGVAITV